ncbi:EAL domain-containing protein [Ningiella sp. W23]|uniref:EAL domain-containing protein n=1 Tax=Ningiella sp. W23 TaxID=3023715 RepID=UPI0037563828
MQVLIRIVLLTLLFVLGPITNSKANELTPKLIDPRLQFLDTSSGLSQDSIHKLLVDQEGFLWIGTDEGLDRYDGETLIHVHGRNALLKSNPVYNIFEVNERYLLLSTGAHGLVKFDKFARESEIILSPKYRFDDQWPQYSDAIIHANSKVPAEQSAIQVFVAFNEDIFIVEPLTNNSNKVFSLSDQQVNNGESIRAIFRHESSLFIGTTKGLWAYSLDSKVSHRVRHTESISDDAINVKSLALIDGDLWIGTVEGLYALDIAQTLKHIYSDWEAPVIDVIDANRNIWAIYQSKSGDIYVGTDLGLFLTEAGAGSLDYLFKPSKHYQAIFYTDVLNIAEDAAGNIWMGTHASGAFLWSPQSLMFENVYANRISERDESLSNNNIFALHQQSSRALWAGTSNGLNRYDLYSGSIEQFLVSSNNDAAYTSSDIVQIQQASPQTLWVAHGEGINEFDTTSGEYLSNKRFGEKVEQLFSQYTHSVFVHPTGGIWVSNESGIYLVNLQTKDYKRIALQVQRDMKSAGNMNSFIGYDAPSNQLMVADTAQLWGIHLDTLEPQMLHSAVPDGASIMTMPNSFTRDRNGRAYVAYSGIGIYQLDGADFSQQALLNTDNILPTDIVYGLSLDEKGDLWFSSHSGIHSLNTDRKMVSSFDFMHGMSSSEFNDGAVATLIDGRLVFGGNLGFTMFDPLSLDAATAHTSKTPVITEISLGSRSLNLPYTNLSGQQIDLQAQDYGLTISYSLLNFGHSNLDKFQYTLSSGSKSTTYPVTSNKSFLLPDLPPGYHQLTITNIGADSDKDSSSTVTFFVKHPRFASPLAYVIYGLIVLAVLIFIGWRRHRLQAVLSAAHLKVNEYNARLTNALRASNSNIWEWRSDTNSFFGARIKESLGADYETMHFDDYVACIDADERSHFLKSWETFLSGDEALLDITYSTSVDNAQRRNWFRDVGSKKILKDGTVSVIGTYTNFTESMASKEKLKLFGEAFKHTRDWVLIYSSSLEPIAANPSFMKAFGIDSRRNVSDQVNRVNAEYAEELRLLSSRLQMLKAGERFKQEVSISIRQRPMTLLVDSKAVPKKNNESEIDHYLNIFTDITDQIQAQRELQKLANYDVLTGLINRSLLIERLRQAIHFSKRHQEKLAVLFIDLDRFKPINDTYGHEAGDKVLIEIASRLDKKFREQDSVARLGGDEFVIVLSEIRDKEALDNLSREVLNLIIRPISIGLQSVTLSGSIGIAQYPEHANDPEHLLRNADIAMYSAKEKGANRYAYFVDAMNEKVHADMLLENRLKVAVKQKTFTNYYQPIVDLKTGKTAGFEMLMRWIDDGEFIPPDVFIPVAEQIGAIIEMTDVAIERAIEDIARWREYGFNGYVAINLSAKHFSQDFNTSTILGILKKHALPPRCIRFEITEGLLMENNEASIACMRQLRGQGFKISLDDFGTGYSSLKYLKDFPIDVLKLDKSFVDDVNRDKGTESIVYSTLVMAGLLKLDAVAEGIETDEQLAYFILSQCRFGQGFYFSRPVPYEQCIDLVNRIWYESDKYSDAKVINMPLKTQNKMLD